MGKGMDCFCNSNHIPWESNFQTAAQRKVNWRAFGTISVSIEGLKLLPFVRLRGEAVCWKPSEWGKEHSPRRNSRISAGKWNLTSHPVLGFGCLTLFQQEGKDEVWMLQVVEGQDRLRFRRGAWPLSRMLLATLTVSEHPCDPRGSVSEPQNQPLVNWNTPQLLGPLSLFFTEDREAS